MGQLNIVLVFRAVIAKGGKVVHGALQVLQTGVRPRLSVKEVYFAE